MYRIMSYTAASLGASVVTVSLPLSGLNWFVLRKLERQEPWQ
jgi:hypothetical protein